MSFTIYQGDALAVLRGLPEASVHCCITSPPYYGLRDYGVDGQIGLEPTPEEFIARLVDVFREVRRVLRDDGTLWVNMGDSYASSLRSGRKESPGVGAKQEIGKARSSLVWHAGDGSKFRWTLPGGQKPKDLIGVPWMLAFALRADGWYLRQDIIWHKPNPMPESVKDRCTKAHEYVFLLSKSQRYWWDAEAVREPAEERPLSSWQERKATEPIRRGDPGQSGHVTTTHTLASREGRNKRSVWTLATLPTPEAHFATFPLELPELCMKAGCPEGGTVLDPFAGAGTTGLACLKNGRAFVGIELNPAYIDIAYQRARKYYPLLVSA